MRILLVEDDPAIADHVGGKLREAGYLVETERDGNSAWERGSDEDFAAIVLDLGLPGLDGLTILRNWRREGITTPVLVLTARGSWMERVDGFDAGADDYLPKPFRVEELLARLRALLRRSQAGESTRLARGRFLLDRAGMTIMMDGSPLSLTPNEFRALAFLIEESARVVTAHELALQAQGRDDDSAKNAVEAMIVRLRRKTFAGAIETRRGFGYQLGTVE